MSALPSWPEPRCDPIGTLSYSEWARARACPLKAAFARDPDTRHWNRGSTWSAVGNARHRLVEDVEAGTHSGLGPPSAAWIRTRFEVLLTAERDRLMQEWSPASVPAVKQWPDTIYVKTRMARDLGGGKDSEWPDPSVLLHASPDKAKELPTQTAAQSAPAAGAYVVEASISDPDRNLYGRVDRMENHDGHLVVVDLKSGIGTPLEELVVRHRDQMIFYAGLVQAAYNQWPGLELHPATGPPAPVPYDPVDVEHLREAVDQDRDLFNTALAAGAMTDAAKPSATACSWCPFQVVCPALVSNWENVARNPDGLPRRDISLAAGTVRTVHHTSMATDVVIEQAMDLSVPAGDVSVTRLPAVLTVEPGDALVVSGAELAGGSRVLRARWDSRVRVEHDDAEQ